MQKMKATVGNDGSNAEDKSFVGRVGEPEYKLHIQLGLKLSCCGSRLHYIGGAGARLTDASALIEKPSWKL